LRDPGEQIRLVTVRAAVIGLGLMGCHHSRVLHEMDNVQLVAVCDPDPLALGRAIRGRDIQGYREARAMLADHQLDLVVVAVPTSAHLQVAVDAMRAGAHVLIEKPIAATCREARQLMAEADSLGRWLTVGHLERFNPAVVELKQRLRRGELGRVFRLHARRLGPFPPRIRDVGVVIDLATHDIDISRYLLDSEPIRIYAETARRIHTAHDDMLAALLRFENDILVQLDVNWLTPTKIRELTVTGECGMFLVNYLTQELSLFENNVTENGVPESPVASVTEGKMVRFKIESNEPLRAELDDVVAAIESDRRPLVKPEDAYRALEIAEAIVAAGRTREVQLQPTPNVAVYA
jgi:predicted dehydrogenase